MNVSDPYGGNGRTAPRAVERTGDSGETSPCGGIASHTTKGLAEMKNAALKRDKAQRRRLNDELRLHGRGGIVSVSLSIAAAGEEVIVCALRAVAQAEIDASDDGSTGTAVATLGKLHWAIIPATDGTVIMTVWLASEVDFSD